MNKDTINLDFSKLLGFRLLAPCKDNNPQSATHFTKVGRKTVVVKESIGKIDAKIGGKIGGKTPPITVAEDRKLDFCNKLGARVGVKKI